MAENRRVNIYLNNQETGKTVKEIAGEYKKLNNHIQKNLIPGTREYQREMKKLRGLKGQLDEHNRQVRQVGSSWDRVKKSILPIGGALAGAFGAQEIVQKMGQMVTASSNLSDAFADVQKTTGLTDKEVRGLSETLKGMDTRTSRQQLLMLARDAGKLGITAKEDIEQFVEAADQVNVALGEDLGEGAIRQLGKINSSFKINQAQGYKDALLKTGSAINEVGQNSEASENDIVRFTTAIQGTAAASDISVKDIIGLGGAVSSLGLKTETAASAIQKGFVGIQQNTAAFAEAANQDLGEFRKLVEEDVNQAFITFLKGVRDSSDSTGELTKKLDELGLGGDEALKSLLPLVNKLGEVGKQQKTANEAFEKGTSLTEEFEKKNNTLGATLDKIKKALKETFVTSGVMDGIDVIADRTLGFIQVLRDSGREIKMVGKAILTVVSAWASYKAATAAATVAQNAYKAATRATGRTLRGTFVRSLAAARAGVRGLTTAIRSNPIGFIASAITTAIAAYQSFKSNVNEATQQQKEFNEAAKEGQKILDRTKEIEEQAQAIEAMNKQRLEQFKNRVQREIQILKEEREKISQTAEKEADAVRKRREQLEEQLTNIREKIANTETQAARDKLKLQEQVKERKLEELKVERSMQGINQMQFGKRMEELNNVMDQIDKRMEIIKKQQDDDDDGGDGDGGDGEDDTVDDAIKEFEKLKEATDKFNEEMERKRLSQKQQQIQQVKDRAAELREQAKAAFEAEKITGEQMAKLMKGIQEGELQEVRRINNKFADEFQKDRQELINEIKNIDISEDINKSEREQLQEHYNKLLQMSQNYSTEEAKIRKRLKEFKKDMNEAEQQNELENMQAMANITRSFGEITGNIMSIMGQQQEKQTAFEKTLALTTIAIESGKALAKGIAQANEVGFPQNLAAIATTVATITANIAQAKSLVEGANTPSAPESESMEVGEVKAEGFQRGGFTGQGDADEPAGVVHKGEWVAPKWMTQSPKFMNTIGMLEAERQKKQGFQAGGNVPAPAQRGSMRSAEEQKEQKEMLNEMRRMNANQNAMVDILTEGIPAKVGLDTREIEDKVIKLRRVRAKSRKKDDELSAKEIEKRRLNEL